MYNHAGLTINWEGSVSSVRKPAYTSLQQGAEVLALSTFALLSSGRCTVCRRARRLGIGDLSSPDSYTASEHQ